MTVNVVLRHVTYLTAGRRSLLLYTIGRSVMTLLRSYNSLRMLHCVIL